MLGAKLSKEQQETVLMAIKNYKGNVQKLEAAIGALFIGSNYGWRVLKIIHSPATYKSYESILGIKYQDVCPERTEISKKSFGLAVADKLQSFWAVATGKTSIKNKQHIDDILAIEHQVNEAGVTK